MIQFRAHGEFSAINWAKGAGGWMRDAIAVFERHGSDWSFHAFREGTPWRVEPVDGSRPSGDNPCKRTLLDGFAEKIGRKTSRAYEKFGLSCAINSILLSIGRVATNYVKFRKRRREGEV